MGNGVVFFRCDIKKFYLYEFVIFYDEVFVDEDM